MQYRNSQLKVVDYCLVTYEDAARFETCYIRFIDLPFNKYKQMKALQWHQIGTNNASSSSRCCCVLSCVIS